MAHISAPFLLAAAAVVASVEQTLEQASSIAQTWGNPWPYVFVAALIAVDIALGIWWLRPDERVETYGRRQSF